jgi:tRNA modification GTPase
MIETIFALSSGGPPAAIAVIRVSGPGAAGALIALAGRLPEPRRATLMRLRDATGALLDTALALWLPGPGTATGEDACELHCHGGRAVIAAVEAALGAMPGMRLAQPGEFTRRAFTNGAIDLAEAEGLADLLEAETELQRRAALAMAGGALSRTTEGWRARLLGASAALEAALDFADEDDVAELPEGFVEGLVQLQQEIGNHLDSPRAETLRSGLRVVIAGPPNAGKSTLFNALVGDDAAIATPLPGTTRDLLQRPVAIDGVSFEFVDTAGLRDDACDPVEQIGVARARQALGEADLVLWLGPEGKGPNSAWEVEAQADRPDHARKHRPRHVVSAVTGAGLDALRSDLLEAARMALPKPGAIALNARQHRLLGAARGALAVAVERTDPLVMAEELRHVRLAFDALLGRSATEDMLDTLFGRFCIGK